MRKMWQSNKQPWATFDHVSPQWSRDRRGTGEGAAVASGASVAEGNGAGAVRGGDGEDEEGIGVERRAAVGSGIALVLPFLQLHFLAGNRSRRPLALLALPLADDSHNSSAQL